MLQTFSGRIASQRENEINGLIQFMREQHCKSYCEIGARHGDTFHHVMQNLGKKVRGCAIDLPGGLWGGAYTSQALSKAVNNLIDNDFTDAYMYLGDSHSEHIIQKVTALAPFDFILIDGDHRYDAVLQDFRDYSPLAKYVAFHDIVGQDQAAHHAGTRVPVEVPRLWAELKLKFPCWEFVDKKSLMGIGVIKVSNGDLQK